MEKKKLLYIITQGEWGGAQHYVYDLATSLTGDFDITIAIGEPDGRRNLQDKIETWNVERGTGNIKIEQLKHMVRPISLIHDILTIFELAKLYKTLKPDIIHLNSSKAGIIGSFASSFLFPRSSFLIYTVHGWIFNEPNRQFVRALYRWLEKFTSRWKDKIVVLSSSDYQSGQQAGIPAKKLVKIPLGIDMTAFLDKEKARQELSKLSPISYLPSHTIIGTIANLYKTKGLDILIESIKILATDRRSLITDHRLLAVIIGEGPERKKLKNLIKKYQLEHVVHLVGAIDNAAQYLPAFDLFALPSRKEGFPYVIMEAIAAAIPIIASDVGGISTIIKNDATGLLVQANDSAELSKQINWAMQNMEAMKQMAQNAQRLISDFSISKMASETLLLYDSLFGLTN